MKEYAIHNIDPMGSSESNVHLAGKITPNVKTSISMDSDFVLMLGGIDEFKLEIPSANFRIKQGEHQEATYEYHNKDVEVKIESDGSFQIELRHADLSNVNRDEIGLSTLSIGSIIGQVNSALACNKNECSLK